MAITVRSTRQIKPDGSITEVQEIIGEPADFRALQAPHLPVELSDLEWYWDRDKIYPKRKSLRQKIKELDIRFE